METIKLGGRMVAQPHDLIALKADMNYTTIIFRNGTRKIVATTLKKLEQRLEPFGFYRTHKNAMVNVDDVKGLVRRGNCVSVTLKNKQQFEVSRRRLEALEVLLQK
ncbi:LytR/AlgR family response regulator transcription factor [Arcticibacterium luteifluviistationis]|nr:LytTR family DNA-binding domain-containing protein [Arcticibacterium luteifluviistationis]